MPGRVRTRSSTTWFARGVDGFRIDVAHALVEHPEFLDNPLVDGPPPADASPGEVFAAYDHRHDLDQEDVLDVYRAWNRIARTHDAVLIGEVYLLEPEAVARYVRDQDALHLAFCFPALHTALGRRRHPHDARDAGDGRGRTTSPGRCRATTTRTRRPASAAASIGARRALAYFTLLCGLPGVPFLYQGDELGLDDGDSPTPPRTRSASATPAPPAATAAAPRSRGSPAPGFGFTTGEPWLPFGDNRADRRTAAAQAGDPASPLERTRELLRARRTAAALATPS